MAAGLGRQCPVCNSAPGKACTVPTVDGRRPVPWLHYRREPDDGVLSTSVRVVNTSNKQAGSTVHRRGEFNQSSTKCIVRGGLELLDTSDAVTCKRCLRRMGES